MENCTVVAVAEAAAGGVSGNDSAADFVRDEDDAATCGVERGAESLRLMPQRQGVFAMSFEEIGGVESEAVDQDGVAICAGGLNCMSKLQRFFDGRPIRRAFCAVELDLALHLLVVAALGGRDESNSGVPLGERVRIAAFAAANAAEDESYGVGKALLHISLLVRTHECVQHRAGMNGRQQPRRRSDAVGMLFNSPSEVEASPVHLWPVS